VSRRAPDRESGPDVSTANIGAVTSIQRFGGAPNLNIHFHMLFPSGLYRDGEMRSLARSHWVPMLASDDVNQGAVEWREGPGNSD
jgi:Putative transposase